MRYGFDWGLNGGCHSAWIKAFDGGASNGAALSKGCSGFGLAETV
jgi:hypothetical protein